jgi:hypothetical protein
VEKLTSQFLQPAAVTIEIYSVLTQIHFLEMRTLLMMMRMMMMIMEEMGFEWRTRNDDDMDEGLLVFGNLFLE